MKRAIIALLLICCVCSWAFGAYASALPKATTAPVEADDDDGFIEFDATITNILGEDISASDWLGSGEARAILTMLLGIDYKSAIENGDELELQIGVKKSYVGSANSDLILYVVMRDATTLITIQYVPLLKMANYYTIDITGYTDSMYELLAEMALNEVCDNYYENTLTDLMTALNELQDIFGED